MALQGPAERDLLARVKPFVETSYGLECLARAEHETSERQACCSGNHHRHCCQRSKVQWKRPIESDRRATPHGTGAHNVHGPAHHVRRDDRVSIDEEQQITRRGPSTGVARGRDLTMADSDNPSAALGRDGAGAI